MGKTTLVLGASPNPDRFSNKAILRLQKLNVQVIAIGRRDIDLEYIKIRKGMPEDIGEIHTITIYLNKKNQQQKKRVLK